MVTIELFYRDEQLVGYELKGHAQSRANDQEFDLVCAALSVLTISITNGLTDVVKLQPTELVAQDGHLRCILPVLLEANQQTQADALLNTLVLSLECLAADYPKHIQIMQRRCTS